MNRVEWMRRESADFAAQDDKIASLVEQRGKLDDERGSVEAEILRRDTEHRRVGNLRDKASKCLDSASKIRANWNDYSAARRARLEAMTPTYEEKVGRDKVRIRPLVEVPDEDFSGDEHYIEQAGQLGDEATALETELEQAERDRPRAALVGRRSELFALLDTADAEIEAEHEALARLDTELRPLWWRYADARRRELEQHLQAVHEQAATITEALAELDA